MSASEPRWHQVPGLAARRDLSVPLRIEAEQCGAEHPEHGRCVLLHNHARASTPDDVETGRWHAGERLGTWWPVEGLEGPR